MGQDDPDDPLVMKRSSMRNASHLILLFLPYVEKGVRGRQGQAVADRYIRQFWFNQRDGIQYRQCNSSYSVSRRVSGLVPAFSSFMSHGQVRGYFFARGCRMRKVVHPLGIPGDDENVGMKLLSYSSKLMILCKCHKYILLRGGQVR